MSDPTVQEQGTFPAENMVSSFFSDKPTDLRFTKVAYQQIVPHTAVDANSKNIEFIMERLDSPFCYLVSDMLMQATVVITKEDGKTLPDTAANIGPCNNLLSSLFASSVMKINDDIITVSGELYPYKCYISKMLTYSGENKLCQQYTSGFFVDFDNASLNIEAKAENVGWLYRCQLFRKNFGVDTEYRPEGVTLVGSFEHELSNCEKCLPPATKLSFNLVRSTDEFILMRQTDADPEDTTKYKMVLTSCCLFIKVGTMSEPIYRELSTRFEKEDLKYQYRKIIVKAITVPPFNQEFLTGNLFPDSETPFRLHFALVKSEAKNGSYKTNPFGFYRKWTITKTTSQSNLAAEVENVFLRHKVESLANKVDSQMEMFMQFFAMYKQQQNPDTNNSATNQSDPVPSTSQSQNSSQNSSAQPEKRSQRITKFPGLSVRGLRERKNLNVRAKNASSNSPLNTQETVNLETETDAMSESSFASCASQTTQARTSHRNIDSFNAGTEEIVFLKSFDLEINSSPLDQVTKRT